MDKKEDNGINPKLRSYTQDFLEVFNRQIGGERIRKPYTEA